MPRLRTAISVYILICLPNASGEAPHCRQSGAARSAQEVSVASCVHVCTTISKKDGPEAIDFFTKNCDGYSARMDAFTERLQKNIGSAALKCYAYAAAKALKAPYDLGVALIQFASYMTSEKPAPEFDHKWDACRQSVPCQAALARSTLRYQFASQAEVEKGVKQLGFDELLQIVQSDRPEFLQLCRGRFDQITNESLQQALATGTTFTYELERKNYLRFATERPSCPAAMNMPPPQPWISASEKWLKCVQTDPNPYSCLSFMEKIAVGAVCMGPNFEKALEDGRDEICSDVVSMNIPVGIPVAKVKTLAFGAREAVQVGKTDAVKLAEGAATRSAVKESAEVLPERISFVQRYTNYIAVTTEKNQHFINLVEDSARVARENKTRVFDGENWVMKLLNDTTRDKNLVTSLTNLQKNILLKHVAELEAKYPGMHFELYSDFKSVKIAIKGEKEFTPELGDQLREDLNSVFQKSNKEFATEMDKLKISVPAAGPPANWFLAGFGRNIDEASLAARRARSSTGESGILDYYSPKVREAMTSRLTEVESSRSALATSSTYKPLMDISGDIPKQEVFDFVRKSKTDEELAAALKQHYGLIQFDAVDAAQLRGYVNGVDEFSPTLLIGKRENANLDAAINGGMSADFLGMGSANLQATAKALKGQKDLPAALQAARRGEQSVTTVFRAKMERFRQIVGGNVICSGDDCVREAVVAMTSSQKIEMVNAVAHDSSTRGVRMAFVGPAVRAEFRMQLAAQGESIEKALRKELAGKIVPKKLSKVTFGLDMETTKVNEGAVNLIIGKGELTRFSKNEQKEIEGAFARALKNINADTSQYIQGTTQLRETTLTFVPGSGIFGIDEGNQNN